MSTSVYPGPPVRLTLRKFKRKLADLQPEERRFAAAAFMCAPIVEVALRTAGLQRTLAWVERISDVERTRDVTDLDAAGIAPARAKHIIDSVYRLHPHLGLCLPRALLQYGLQRRRGADVRFVVGVKRPDAATIDAHAWVELASAEFPDSPESTEFASILRSGAT